MFKTQDHCGSNGLCLYSCTDTLYRTEHTQDQESESMQYPQQLLSPWEQPAAKGLASRLIICSLSLTKPQVDFGLVVLVKIEDFFTLFQMKCFLTKLSNNYDHQIINVVTFCLCTYVSSNCVYIMYFISPVAVNGSIQTQRLMGAVTKGKITSFNTKQNSSVLPKTKYVYTILLQIIQLITFPFLKIVPFVCSCDNLVLAFYNYYTQMIAIKCNPQWILHAGCTSI